MIQPGTIEELAAGCQRVGQRRVFATYYGRLFPEAFHKGVGRIAYHFASFEGWRGWLVHSELRPSPVPRDYGEHVDVFPLGRTGESGVARLRRAASFARFLLRHAREIDALNLYDLRPETYLCATLYKGLNPEGVVFIKLDMDQRAVDMLQRDRKTASQRLNEWLLERSSVDFVTVETRQIENQIRAWFERRGIPLHRVPIGFSHPTDIDLEATLGAKEDLVVSVGRLGTKQKHNELLVEAVCRLEPDVAEGWRIVFIGPGAASFRAWVQRRTSGVPHARAAITVLDPIRDRAELFAWYRRAKVFCLTSRWESFCTVLAEALYFGCYLVSTRVGAAEDLTGGGADGRLIDVGDEDALVDALRAVMTAPAEQLARDARRCHERVRDEFAWDRICRDLLSILERSRAPLATGAVYPRAIER